MPVYVSIGILAWNEEKTIASALESLSYQSLFERLAARGAGCEAICVANGCTDRTVAVASRALAREGSLLKGRVVDLAERGRNNAWNHYVHRLSAPEARFLILMDADIVLHGSDTLWKMLETLEGDAEANIAVDRPFKELAFKRRKSPRDRLSLSVSQITRSAPAQVCGQLYCIRSRVARKIYLPRDLAACEDGFIKALVCSDFLSGPTQPQRIKLAEGARHVFSAYTSVGEVFRNQKRQVLGQTIVHILIDGCLKELPGEERARLAEVLQARDTADPGWIKRLIAIHLKSRRFFWQLYPGLPGNEVRRLASLPLGSKLACFPAALARMCFVAMAGVAARRMLKRGCTDYWPKAPQRALSLRSLSVGGTL